MKIWTLTEITVGKSEFETSADCKIYVSQDLLCRDLMVHCEFLNFPPYWREAILNWDANKYQPLELIAPNDQVIHVAMHEIQLPVVSSVQSPYVIRGASTG